MKQAMAVNCLKASRKVPVIIGTQNQSTFFPILAATIPMNSAQRSSNFLSVVGFTLEDCCNYKKCSSFSDVCALDAKSTQRCSLTFFLVRKECRLRCCVLLQGFPLKKIVKYASNRDFTDLMVFNEDRKSINGVLLVHLPGGPTAHFKLSNLVLSKDIKVGLSHQGADQPHSQPVSV